MAKNEIELAVEIGTGILPGGKLTAKMRRTWASRAEQLRAQLVEETGLTLGEIEDAVTSDDQLGDLLINASERIVRTGELFYRQALGKAVAAALRGDVPIDQAEILIDQLIALDVEACAS